ncbi:MAG TPA: V-type ATP synthase subunit E [Lachnospiraceae bacterium]|nr:V-type ATP synthase subunit E [Lachnospiraceae bacterium]
MTIDEKLQNFYDFSMDSATKEGQELLDEYQMTLDKVFADHKAMKEKQAADALKDETAAIRRDMNKKLSSRQSEIRQAIAEKQTSIKDNLFDKTEARLMAMKGTPEYMAFVCGKIKDAKDFAGSDPMVVYIDPSDAPFLEEIRKETSVTPVISREEFLGGMRAVIASKHILIDNSFKTLLSEAKSNFTFDGGKN